MKVRLFAAAALAALVGLALPRSSPAVDRSASIYDTLAQMDNHAVLYIAIREAKEVAALKGNDKYTLFVPTDDAFKKLDEATFKKIITNEETVKQLLQAHMVPGEYSTTRLKKPDEMGLRTLRDTALKVEDGKEGLRVGGAKIVEPDYFCRNGVIHVIDTVLPLTK